MEDDIVIAGVGIAAAAVAIQLLNNGFRPVLLSRRLSCIKGIEAISESALSLFEALDLLPALENTGFVCVEGFENAWQSNETIIRSGRYIHVERTVLLQALMFQAIDRGAKLVSCNTIPTMRVEHDCVFVSLDGVERQFMAAIDATGRSSIWSRTIRWHHREIAEIYNAVCDKNVVRGRIAQISGGWVYRLGLPDRMTVGIVRSHRDSLGQIDTLISEKLCLGKAQLYLIGRRPAFPQWAEEPVKGRRIAVGDTALASNPIAGQGIRFALSSALAAAAVIRTWRDSPADRDGAKEFYNELVTSEREKHLSSISSLYANEPVSTLNKLPKLIFNRTTLPLTVCFTGQIKMVNLNINGLIQPSEAFVLPDGKVVRWIGNFDLLTLQELSTEPLATTAITEYLTLMQISQEDAVSIIWWCLEHQIFSKKSF